MYGVSVRSVRFIAVRVVVATGATAVVCSYCSALASSGLALPSQRPTAADVVDTAAIDPSSSTVGIADSSLYEETPAEIDKTLDTLESIGVQDVRIFVPWAIVEPTQGSYDWSVIDDVVDAAAARNMGVAAEISGTPTWATTGGLGNGQPTPSAYASFAGTVAARYGSGISAYEVWNEPNSVEFYDPISAAAYTQLLKAAYPAIKAADPTATVIAGALGAGTTFGDLTLNPVTFVQEMYADGAEGYFDALSFHPYQETLEFSQGGSVPNSPINQLAAIYALMTANGDASKKVWLTEYGLSTADVSQQTQATYLQDLLSSWQSESYGGPVFVYTTRDANTGDGATEDNYGIYDTDWTPKAAVAVIQQAIANAKANANPLATLAAQFAAAAQAYVQQLYQAIVTALLSGLSHAAATPAATTQATTAVAEAAVAKTAFAKTAAAKTAVAKAATTDPMPISTTALEAKVPATTSTSAPASPATPATPAPLATKTPAVTATASPTTSPTTTKPAPASASAASSTDNAPSDQGTATPVKPDHTSTHPGWAHHGVPSHTPSVGLSPVTGPTASTASTASKPAA